MLGMKLIAIILLILSYSIFDSLTNACDLLSTFLSLHLLRPGLWLSLASQVAQGGEVEVLSVTSPKWSQTLCERVDHSGAVRETVPEMIVRQ